MSGKRRWSDFPKRLKAELDSTAAMVGLGGVGLGGAGLAFLPPPLTQIAFGLGGAITLGAVGFSMFRAVPPKLINVTDLVGRPLTLSDLEKLSTKLPLVAIVGPRNAGKTTLRNRLSFIRSDTVRTDSITAQVVPLPTAPPRYIAVLDGGGHVYRHQFRLAEFCDHLCLIMDHNRSDTALEPDGARIDSHREFLEQISNSIREYRKDKLQTIMVLWNKRDLWEKSDPAALRDFEQLREDVIKDWRMAGFADEIFEGPHSNELPNDVAHVVERFIAATATAEVHQ